MITNAPVKTKQAAALPVAKELYEEDEKGFEVVEQETVVKKKNKPTTGYIPGAQGNQRGRY